jgi:SulP family sulfate permease
MSGSTRAPSFIDLFTPKLVTVLREGYGLQKLRADIVAGLTVAIVALPLSMAIAIASGVTPDRGLYSAIVGGFIVSLLGGSRFQIGGPAGAFIVLVSATVDAHGVDGVLLATAISGVILMAVGFLRLGAYIKYIPYPVTVGFTSGIAVIIFSSQIKDLLGMTLPGKEPGPFVAKLSALSQAWPSISPAAVAVTVLSVGVVLAVRRWRPAWPAFLIAVCVGSGAAVVLGLPVATIGTVFGGIPHSLPPPHVPTFSVQKIIEVLPAAVSFALLGGIESLLSAVVADSMSGRRHRSNSELVAQGVANIGASLFGGICVTGTIARTATNVRAGARGPIAGMLHSVFLLLFMLVAAPLASYIPLAALASVLAVVSWNMFETHAFRTLIRASRGDAVVLLATFLLVVFRDLTEGIVVGFSIGALLFLHRMAQSVEIESGEASGIVPGVDDVADSANGVPRPAYDPALATDPDIAVHRIAGAFFFGAAASVAAALDRIGAHPKAHVVDLSAVHVLDSTAAATIEGFAHQAVQAGAVVYIAGASIPIRRVLLAHGVRRPLVKFSPSMLAAVEAARGQNHAEAV